MHLRGGGPKAKNAADPAIHLRLVPQSTIGIRVTGLDVDASPAQDPKVTRVPGGPIRGISTIGTLRVTNAR
jgi:hypothetical protein